MKKPRKKIPAAGTAKPPRKKWWEGEISTKEATAWLEEEFGPIVHFQDDKVSDFLWPGLTDEQMFDPAFEAVVHADLNKDHQRLIDFVRSNTLSEWGRELLADFLHRRLIHGRLPIYEMPPAEIVLDRAKKSVREEVAAGLSRDDAIAKVAKDEGIPVRILMGSLEGKRHSGRRAAKGVRGAVPKKKG